MGKKINYCLIGGDSGICSEFIKLLKDESILITSRKKSNLVNSSVSWFNLDVSSAVQLTEFDNYLKTNDIIFENVIYFVGIHNKRDKDINLLINFYSLVYIFSIIKQHMHETSTFTYISSEAHRHYKLPLNYIKGYSLSKISSMTFLYNIKQKVNFKIKIYSPPFSKTKLINDKKYFFNNLEHFFKVPVKSKIVSKRLYDYIKNNNKNVYFSNDKPSYMHKDVYKKNFYIKILNNISTFTHSEYGMQYKPFFNNLHYELYSHTLSLLKKNKMYFQYCSNLVSSNKLKKKIINVVSKYSNPNNKVVVNINTIKNMDYNLYLDLMDIYKKLAIDLTEQFNIKFNCISTNSTESIDIYHYPNNIFIKDHTDHYQKPNEFKFNTIIESNKYSPMYVIHNNVKIYPLTNCGILARVNKLTHGVDEYKNVNRYLLQFVFDSDIEDGNDNLIHRIIRKNSKILRYLENTFNIANSQQ